MISLPKYHQGDRRWADRKLLPSSRTMASDGCFVTSVCMALHNHGIGFRWTPGEFLEKVIEVNGLTPEGLLIWDAVRKVTNGICCFHERVYTENSYLGHVSKMKTEAAIHDVRRLLDLGQPTLLAVDLVGNDGKEDHAVMAYDYQAYFPPLGEDLDKNVKSITEGGPTDFRIHDPAFGDDIWFSHRYGDPHKGLHGYVSIIGPGLEYPDQSVHRKEGKALWKAMQVRQGIHVQTYAREIIDHLLG